MMSPTTSRAPRAGRAQAAEHERQREDRHHDDGHYARDSRPVGNEIAMRVEVVGLEIVDVAHERRRIEQVLAHDRQLEQIGIEPVRLASTLARCGR